MSENGLTDISLKTKSRIFYGWIIVAAIFPAAMISYGTLYTFGVFLIPLRDAFGATSAAISGAYSLAVLLYMGCGIPFGWVTDKYGPKITTIIGGLFMASGFLLTSQVNTVWQLYLTYALVGIGLSPTYSPLMATINRWFSRRRGLALGVVTAGIGIGPVILAPLATRLIAVYGWRFAYIVLACTLAPVIPAAFLMKRSPEEIGEVPDGIKNSTVESSKKQLAIKVAPAKQDGLSLKQAIRTGAFWRLATTYFFIGLGLQTVMAHIVAYGQGKGLSPITAATILSTISGLSIAGRLTMGFTSDVIGHKRALAICLFTEGTMVLLLTQASPVWMFFLFAIIYGFSYGGHVPQLPALVGETMGLAHMAIMLGATSFFWGVGGAIGPFFAGWIVDVTGSYIWAFVVGGCAFLIAAVNALLLKRQQ